MQIETFLLILESVLLVATVVLLVFSIREGRSRNALIMEVGRATRVLVRHEYFNTVVHSMMDARLEVVGCITGRLPAGEDSKRIKEVIFNIEKLTGDGVKVRYLLPKFQDRLHVGWLYTRAGAEVRYSGCVLVHDFRYTVVDEKAAVIGIPEATGEKEATKKGFKVPSEGLSSVLRKHFYECWEGNPSYEEYIRETIEQTGTTARLLARELRIDEQEIERASRK